MIVKNYFCNLLWKFLIKIESTWRREIKEQAPQLTLLYCGRSFRSSHQRCSLENSVLKNFAISTGSTCVGLSFLKSYRSEGPQSVFLWILENFKDYIFWKTSVNSCFLTFSMAQCYMGLKVQDLNCMIASGFRVWVTGLGFVFKSASFFLNRVSTFVWKPNADTFDKSVKFWNGLRWFQVVLGRF